MVCALVSCGTANDQSPIHAASGTEESPLAKYLSNTTPLATPCSFASKTATLTVSLNPNESVNIGRRSVDSALLVQGDTCVDSSVSPSVTAIAARVRIINVQADATSGSVVDLSGTSEVVVIDVSNGTFALASSSGGGIFVNLGGGGDVVSVLGSKSADKFGCVNKSGQDCLGLASATSADVKVTGHPNDSFTVDMAAGNDSFDKGTCTTRVDIYGSAGADTFLAGSDITITGDHYHGGSEIDTISYAARTSSVTVVADGVTNSGDASEQDLVDSDIENIVGGAGDDTLTAALDSTAKHTLTGGLGNDTLISLPGGGTTFAGGGGIDTVDYSARAHGVTVTIGDGRANDGETGDLDNVGLDVENVVGTDHDDVITGSGIANTITPGAGNDTVNAGDGNDVIIASASLDGSDTISGGKGTDTVDYSARSTGVCVVLDGISHSGSCTFNMGSPAMNVSSNDSDLIATDVENVVGTTDADHLIGNSAVNALFGLGGLDWLEGKSGDDQLDANAYGSNNGYTCDPVTHACLGDVVDPCDCANSSLQPVCSASAVLDCGGDPLDIGSCSGANAGQFIGCWRTQY